MVIRVLHCPYWGSQSNTHQHLWHTFVLLNGGGQPASNFYSHLLHVRQFSDVLRRAGVPLTDITIFNADGADPTADFAVRDQQSEADFWLLEGTRLERPLRPHLRYENSVEAGDIMLGPPDAPFTEPQQIREWVMTAPLGTPTPVQVLRRDQWLRLTLTPQPYPITWPALPGPPTVGSEAPPLRELKPYRGTLPAALTSGGPYLLFFWATWCAPCKASLPEGVTGTPAFLLGYTEADGAQVKAVKFLVGALPFNTFKEHIDKLLDAKK